MSRTAKNGTDGHANGHADGHADGQGYGVIDGVLELAEAERRSAATAGSNDLRDEHLIRAERYASLAWSIDEGYVDIPNADAFEADRYL